MWSIIYVICKDFYSKITKCFATEILQLRKLSHGSRAPKLLFCSLCYEPDINTFMSGFPFLEAKSPACWLSFIYSDNQKNRCQSKHIRDLQTHVHVQIRVGWGFLCFEHAVIQLCHWNWDTSCSFLAVCNKCVWPVQVVVPSYCCSHFSIEDYWVKYFFLFISNSQLAPHRHREFSLPTGFLVHHCFL